MARKPTTIDTQPEDFAQANPRDLYATSDIRFVIRETATLAERLDGLSRTIDKLGDSFEKALERHASDVKERIHDVKADLKAIDVKVVEIEKKVEFVRGARWVLGGVFALMIVLLGVIAAKLLT